MAQTWTYNDWRTYSGTAQRERLILHIQEVENYLADWQQQSGGGQSGQRHSLESYLARLERNLDKLDAALGLGIDSMKAHFTEAKPI